MTFEDMREFLLVAELGSFPSAASGLHQTASILYRHMKRMEDEIGKPLFEGNMKNVVLSPYGEILLPYARSLLEIEEEMLAAVGYGETDTLAVSCDNYAMLCYLPVLLTRLSQETGISLELICGEDEAVKNRIRRGINHLAFTVEIGESPGYDLAHIPIYEDRFVAVLPKGRQFPERLGLRDLRKETWIVPQMDHGFNKKLYTMCEAAGFSIEKRCMVTGGLRSIHLIEAAQEGRGVLVIRERILRTLHAKGMDRLKVLSIEDAEPLFCFLIWVPGMLDGREQRMVEWLNVHRDVVRCDLP